MPEVTISTNFRLRGWSPSAREGSLCKFSAQCHYDNSLMVKIVTRSVRDGNTRSKMRGGDRGDGMPEKATLGYGVSLNLNGLQSRWANVQFRSEAK